MMALGVELEFSIADVMRFHSGNRRQGKVVSKGTSAMLFTWRDALRQYAQREAKDVELGATAMDDINEGEKNRTVSGM